MRGTVLAEPPVKKWRKPRPKYRRVWVRHNRHLAMEERIMRLMVTWLGCLNWTRHDWPQERA